MTVPPARHSDPELDGNSRRISAARVRDGIVAGVGKALAVVCAVVFAAVVLALLWIAFAESQIGWDDFNYLQFVLGIGAAVAVGVALACIWDYIFNGILRGKELVASLILAAVLSSVWWYGLSAWCSGCGVP